MATPTVQPGTAPANPPSCLMPFRRSTLGMVAAAPAGLPVAPTLPPADLDEWRASLSAFLAAKVEADRFDEEYARPAIEAFEQLAPRPAISFEVIAESGQAATYHFDPDQPEVWLHHPVLPLRKHGERLHREWTEYRARKGVAALATNIDAMRRRSDELSEACCDAEDRMLATPAPDGAALAQKILLSLDDGREIDFTLSHILADARRLAGA